MAILEKQTNRVVVDRTSNKLLKFTGLSTLPLLV